MPDGRASQAAAVERLIDCRCRYVWIALNPVNLRRLRSLTPEWASAVLSHLRADTGERANPFLIGGELA
jgi:hypothetical protein